MEVGLALLRQLLLLGALLWPAQLLWPGRPEQRLWRGGLLLDLALSGVVTTALSLGGPLLLAGMSAAWAWLLPGPLEGALRSLPFGLQFALALLLSELGAYAAHRLAHAWAPLWAIHRLHHSSAELDWLSAFRQNPLDALYQHAATNLGVALLGFDPEPVLAFVLFQKLHTAFVHANLALPHGPWEELVALPRFHHRHHDEGAPAANFAALFPWIDRLGGTRA